MDDVDIFVWALHVVVLASFLLDGFGIDCELVAEMTVMLQAVVFKVDLLLEQFGLMLIMVCGLNGCVGEKEYIDENADNGYQREVHQIALTPL